MWKKLQEHLVLLNDTNAMARLPEGKSVTAKAIVYSLLLVGISQNPKNVKALLIIDTIHVVMWFL